MKLYVCYGTWKPAPRPGGHPCGRAYDALVGAGYDPDVKRVYGVAMLPGLFNLTPGRREVKRLTGNYWVPVLVADDGEVIQGSREIEAWATGSPGAGSKPVGGGGMTERRQATLAEIEDWEHSGATWRSVELSDERAVLDLCSCSGERMERVESDDPELIAFVQAHPGG